MGCKSSKEQTQCENIEYNFEAVGIERYDKQWEEQLVQLKQLEKTRMEIELLLINLQTLTSCTQLKSHTLQDLLNVYMWCVLARHQASFDEVSFELQSVAPYFQTKGNNMSMEIQEFRYTFDQLMINIYQNKTNYDQLCLKVQKHNQNIQVQNSQIKVDVASFPQQTQVIMIKNQQKNTQIYRGSIAKIVAYQKEFDQIKVQMDAVASSFLKNKNDLVAKAKQLMANNYLELNQAIHIHPGSKLTDKPLEDKLKEFEEKHQVLQIEFKKISKKPSSVILKKMPPAPIKKIESPVVQPVAPKREEKESLREVMQQKKLEMLKAEQERQRKLQEEQLKASQPAQIQEQAQEQEEDKEEKQEEEHGGEATQEVEQTA